MNKRLLLIGVVVAAVLAWALARLHGQELPPAPALSELEQALVENVNLRQLARDAQLEADRCRGEHADARAAATTKQIDAALEHLRHKVAADHPGYDWDPATGNFTKRPEVKR